MRVTSISAQYLKKHDGGAWCVVRVVLVFFAIQCDLKSESITSEVKDE